MKKILYIFLILCAILSLFGCELRRNQKEISVDNTDYFADKIVIALKGDKNDALSRLEKELESRFSNTDIEFQCIPQVQWTETLRTSLEVGKIPDAIIFDELYMMRDYIEQGFFCKVPRMGIKNNAPLLYEDLIKQSEDIWYNSLYKGENWGLPIPGRSLKTSTSLMLNNDWLNKLNVTKLPQSISDFESLFEKMVHNDPDGNGKEDTYAICPAGRNDTLEIMSAFFGAFGVYPNMWMKKDNGTLQYGIITEDAKKAISQFAEWYKKGYIDPEFITATTKIQEYKWKNNRIGIMSANAQTYGSVNGMGTLINAPVGKDGFFAYKTNENVTSVITFSKNLSEQPKKLEKLLKIFDTIATDKNLMLECFNDDNGILQVELMPIQPTTKELENSYQDIFISKFAETQKNGNIMNGIHYISWIKYYIPQEFESKYNEINNLSQQWLIDFIIGKKSIDEFYSFVSEWKKSGGEQITQVVNECFVGKASQELN